MSARTAAALTTLTSNRALAGLALACVTTTACAVVLLTQETTAQPEPVDRAFLDDERTSGLIASTTALVDQVFSVDPSRRAATARSVDRHLSPAARDQFRELYAAYLSKRSTQITLRTTTMSVGVVSMEGDEADVLVVAEQAAAAPDGRTNSGTATLRLELVESDDDWQIAKIEVV